MEPTLQEITDTMSEAVDIDSKLKRKFNATVLFDVDGEEYTLRASKKDKDTIDLRVKTSLQTLRDLLQKKMTPQQAFMKGDLKIKGKMSLAMKLAMVLDATRKHLASMATSRL